VRGLWRSVVKYQTGTSPDPIIEYAAKSLELSAESDSQRPIDACRRKQGKYVSEGLFVKQAAIIAVVSVDVLKTERVYSIVSSTVKGSR